MHRAIMYYCIIDLSLVSLHFTAFRRRSIIYDDVISSRVACNAGAGSAHALAQQGMFIWPLTRPGGLGPLRTDCPPCRPSVRGTCLHKRLI